MKIALLNGLCSIPSKEAESIFSMKMCEAYADQGHEVSLFVSNHQDLDLQQITLDQVFKYYQVKNNFKIIRTNIFKSKIGLLWSLAFSIPFRVKLKGYDFIHARNLATAWGAAKWMNLPVVYEMHNTPDSNESQLKMFRDFCKSPNCKMIITITKALADHIQQYIPSKVKVIVQPDGVSESSLISLGDKEELRLALGIDSGNKKVAVYTGHLYRGRGIELIIQLAERLSNQYYFIIAGGREEDILFYKTMSAHLTNLDFVGHRSQLEVIKYQQAADVLLMPYDYKVSASGGGNTAAFASPMKMFEYMATGRPMISSTLPILYEIISNNIHAIMVPYEDIDGWEKSLNYLDTHPLEGEIIGANAKKEVEKYTWRSRVNNILESVYQLKD